MELIRGNLLVLVSLLSMAAFGVIWGCKSDFQILACFCFLRKELEKREWILMGKIMLLVTVVSIIIYYGIGYLVKAHYVNPVMFLVIPLTQCIWYLVAICAVVRGSVIQVLFASWGLFGFPCLLIACVGVWKLHLDDFAGWIIMGLFVLNILVFRQSKAGWREGDFL